MRVPRIKEPGGGYYHVLSRVVDRRRIFDRSEKQRFCALMRKVEKFCGVQVLTHAVLGNHFHILVHIPAPQPVSDELFEERLLALYDRARVRNIMAQLRAHREKGRDEAAEQLKAPYVVRMCELSEFGKTLKQRFSQSYNRRHGRKGTLWEERFKSVLIQGSARALSAVAAYIDLNPVRAGIVSDPAMYRFSGYGEAVGGCRRARRGLRVVMQSLGQAGGWQAAHDAYRKLLYVSGQRSVEMQAGAAGKPGFSRGQLQAVLDGGGKLSLQQALHCRVRYFTDALILGSRAYVDDTFGRHRDRFGPGRSSGARVPVRADLGGLCVARRLQRPAISVPAG